MSQLTDAKAADAIKQLTSSKQFRGMVALELEIALDTALMKLLNDSYPHRSRISTISNIRLEVEVWVPRDTRRVLNECGVSYDDFTSQCLVVFNQDRLSRSVLERCSANRRSQCLPRILSSSADSSSPPSPTALFSQYTRQLDEIDDEVNSSTWVPTGRQWAVTRGCLLKLKYKYLNPAPRHQTPHPEHAVQTKVVPSSLDCGRCCFLGARYLSHPIASSSASNGYIYPTLQIFLI